MKFKKVEIQAFRAYDDVTDGTFNFETSPNQYADFIAIYAPNGFGKTSFYDAVEWGFTNKINRFDKNEENELLAKEERSLVKDHGERGKQFIIRNRSSQQDEGFVRLYTTIDENPIENKVPIVHVGQTDYKYNDQVSRPGTEYFHDVLLSQEYIDAFLKEDDAKERYRKFINFFGDKKLDSKYKLVSSLIKLCEIKIAGIKKDSQGIQSKLSFDSDEDILSSVNEKITELNSHGEQIDIIGAHFTDLDFVNFSNAISERIVNVESERQANGAKLTSINTAFLGNEFIKGIEEYFTLRNSAEGWHSSLEALKLIKTKFESRTVLSDQINSLVLKRGVALAVRDELVQIRAIYPNYSRIHSSIENLVMGLDFHKTAISRLGQKLIDLEEIRAEYIIKEKDLEAKQILLQKEIADAPHKNEIIGTITQQNRLEEQSLELKKKEVSKSAESTNAVALHLLKIEGLLQETSNNVYNIVREPEFVQFAPQVENLVSLNVSVEDLTGRLNTLGEKIHQQEILNTDLKEFITRGAEIVNAAQSSTCPLCSEKYDNYNTLLDRITQNSLLDEALTILLEERRELENSLRAIRDELSIQIQLFTNQIRSYQEESHQLHKRVEEDWLKAKKEYEQRVLDFETRNSQLVLHIKYFEGLTLHDFIESKKGELLKVSTLLKEITLRIEENKKEHAGQLQEVEITKKKMEIEQEHLKEVSADPGYLRLSNYFKERSHLPATIETLDIAVEEMNSSVRTTSNELDLLQAEVKSEDTVLQQYSENKVLEDCKLLEERIELAKSVTSTYSRFLEAELNIQVVDKDITEITALLTEVEKSLKIRNLGLEAIIQKLNLLLQLKENVLPYLKFQEQKRTLNQLKEDLEFQEKSVLTSLRQERQSLSDFIHTQVQSFFYENVINKIYQKIDPHPDYKQIKFHCDFSGDEPRLNVFVIDENSSNPMIPSLYFSTAQLNILSLSIFLAKALNAKDSQGKNVDCIFVDDPIQAMDSINVLSTIDLIRSIVVNLGKQVILSTHDENFYNLLMKKIPKDIFNSKYLELETFGRVKKVN